MLGPLGGYEKMNLFFKVIVVGGLKVGRFFVWENFYVNW